MPFFRSTRVRPRLIALGLTVLALALPAGAATDQASNDGAYRVPPQVLVDLIDAPPTPSVRPDPRREWLLVLQRPNLPPISELAERELRLGGLRFRPRNNGPSRASYFTGMELLRVNGQPGPRISGLPAGARIENVRWSPDGTRFAFTNTRPDGIELWVADVATGQARRLIEGRLNLTARGVSPEWLSDNRTLVVTLVPDGRGPEPVVSEVPSGPIVRENAGRTAPARTFQDLLKSPSDEALFEHYLTSQVARVDLDGKVAPLGRPGIVTGVEPSPDGRYLLVQTLHRPFSYLLPAYRFPRSVEVWDLGGKTVYTVADIALQEDMTNAFDSVPRGPRGVSWRDDAPATLVWAEAVDDGDATREAAERDRIVLQAAPFQGEPAPFMTLGFRSAGVFWGGDGLAMVSELWWKTRKTRTWLVRAGGKPELLFDRSFEDRYSDPGFPVFTTNAWGRQVVRTADGGRTVFLIGEGASSEGDRPFLDAFDLTTRKARRLFRSEAPYYEEPKDLLDDAGRTLLVSRESVDEPANYYVRDLKSGQLRAVTRIPHPTPQLKGIQKELIRYQRADGVQLTATLYTPAGWKPSQGPLPMVFWAYPQEFKTADAAGQVNTSPYRFVRAGAGSPLVWLLLGYAVLDDPSMPIVGEGDKEPNDTYIDQLVASAKAAVDEMARRGVGDPRRIAIGGHSYGAFTTANLLAHSDLFAAGIAQSGAYNRTLTPFGFQAEERDLWKAPEAYIKMSPFMYADKINEPLLLIHGQADNNSGTDPIQSERFFNALKGKGAMARLVMLPLESHGYRGRESVLHALWENYNWLETYVKNRPAEEKKAGAP